MALNANTTDSTGLEPGQVTHYQETMLDFIKPNLVHMQFATPKKIPKNRGKITQFRRFTPPDTVTTALSEIVIPDGQLAVEVEITATVFQYGAYFTTSSPLTLTHMDITETGTELAELSGDQGGRSVDEIVRDEMATTTNAQYATGNTAIYTILATEKMTSVEIRRAVRTLDNNNAIMFKGAYVGILSPYTRYDIQDDTLWKDVSVYSEKEQIFTGEIGKLFGVKFVVTSVAKKYVNDNLVAGTKQLTIASRSSKILTVDEEITAAEALTLVGRYIAIYDVDGAVYERHLIAAATAAAAGSATITTTAVHVITFVDGDICYANEYGQNSNTVHGTFIFGDRSYAVADIKGSKKIRILMKDKKVIGGPLEQFSTVGWKVEGMAVTILQDLWIVQVFTGASGT